MKKLLLLPALLISGLAVAQSDTKNTETLPAQADTTIPGNDPPLVIVEEMPEFPGGQSAMMSYIQKHVSYPKAARKKGISGTTYVTFVVEKDCTLSNVKTLKGVLDGELLDKEAVRVVKSMPRWKPGIQAGKAVRTQFNLPIKFTLRK